jgi:hypothetical protein
VFFANNTKDDACDFRVEADFSEKSCVVYAGQPSSKVAKVCRALFLYLFIFWVQLIAHKCIKIEISK